MSESAAPSERRNRVIIVSLCFAFFIAGIAGIIYSRNRCQGKLKPEKTFSGHEWKCTATGWRSFGGGDHVKTDVKF